MDNKKIGTVIKIPNDTTIVIHTPKKNVSRGDTVIVYEELSDINDLEGNKLGTFDFNKAELEVTENYGHYIIARNVVRKESLVDLANPLLKSYISFEKINVNEKDNEQLKSNSKSISIGDPVKFSN